MPLTCLQEESHAKVSWESLKSHTDTWIMNNHHKSRTILLVILSVYKCFEEGRLAGAHVTLKGAKTGKRNASEAERKLTRPLLEEVPVISGQEGPPPRALCCLGNSFQGVPPPSLPGFLLPSPGQALGFCLPALISK